MVDAAQGVNSKNLLSNIQAFGLFVDATRAAAGFTTGWCGGIFGGFLGYGCSCGPIFSVPGPDYTMKNAIANIGAGFSNEMAAFRNAMAMLSPDSPGTISGSGATLGDTTGITNKSVCFKNMKTEQLEELRQKERAIKDAEEKEQAEKDEEKKKSLTAQLERLKAEYRDLEKKYGNGVQLSKVYGDKEYKFYTNLQGDELKEIQRISAEIEDAKKAIAKDEQKYIEKYNKKCQEIQRRERTTFVDPKTAFSETEKLMFDTEKKAIDDKKQKLADKVQKLDEWIENTATADAKPRKFGEKAPASSSGTSSSSATTGASGSGKADSADASSGETPLVSRDDDKKDIAPAPTAGTPLPKKEEIIAEIKKKPEAEGLTDAQIEAVYKLIYKDGSITTQEALTEYLSSTAFYTKAAKDLHVDTEENTKQAKLAMSIVYSKVSKTRVVFPTVNKLGSETKGPMKAIIKACMQKTASKAA